MSKTCTIGVAVPNNEELSDGKKKLFTYYKNRVTRFANARIYVHKLTAEAKKEKNN